MRKILITTLTVLFPFMGMAQQGAKTVPGFAVVELFTSQGDINCPQADKILSDVIADAEKNNKPVYCISLHVDFWNRFGWKDPFSGLRYTRRLQNYSSAFADKETYTPRFIINGKPVPDNPDSKKITEVIRKELSANALMNPEFSFEIFDDTLDIIYNMNFDFKKSRAGSDYYINAVIVEKALSTKVTKGDNAGKTLMNDNVSRLFYTTNLQSPKGVLRVPLRGQKKSENKSLIVFVQDKKSKEIVGANMIEFK